MGNAPDQHPGFAVGDPALWGLAHDAVIERAPTGEILLWSSGAEDLYGWKSDEVLGRVIHLVLRRAPATVETLEAALSTHAGWQGKLTHICKDGSEVVVHSQQVRAGGSGARPAVVLEIDRSISAAQPALVRLHQSEERFRLMVEAVQDYAIFMLDADGYVVSWNSGAERLNGYRADQIVGHHFSRFYTAEDLRAGRPAEGLRAAAETGRVADEGWRVRRNGSLFWASMVITAFRDPAGVLQGFAEVTRDYTERRRLEERLLFQSHVLASVGDAVIAADENLVITAWNGGAERLYGWRADEVLGRKVREILQTQTVTGDVEEARRVLFDVGEWRGEVIQRHKDGRALHVDATTIAMSDGPTHVVSVNRDISDRKRALVVEERGRIARELHDSVSQALFAMTLQARALELGMEGEGRGPGDPMGEVVANIRDLTRGALAEMHALIFELRPDALAEEGLQKALQKHAAALEAKNGLKVDISVPPHQIVFEPAVEQSLYRLAQEALTNVAKHAAASNVEIRLSCEATTGAIELVVTDDGVGFDTGLNRPGHLGLKIMWERAASLGGTLQVTSTPGGGTTVRASVPGSGRATPS